MSHNHLNLPKDLIIGAIASPVVLLLFDLVVQVGLVLWLMVTIGLLLGILLSRHKVPTRSKYQQWSTKPGTKQSTVTNIVVNFALLVAFIFVGSVITHFFGSYVTYGILGLLMGIGEGVLLWLIWLHVRSDKANRMT